MADLSYYTQILDMIQMETVEEARVALVDEFEAYLAQEVPFVPLWFYYSLHVESKTVENIDYPSSSYCNENVWEWVKTN